MPGVTDAPPSTTSERGAVASDIPLDDKPIALGRARRSNAGNRMSNLLALEEQQDEQAQAIWGAEEWQETLDDADFDTAGKDDSDIPLESSSDDSTEEEGDGDDLEGEKELEKQQRLEHRKKRKHRNPFERLQSLSKKARIESPSTPQSAPSPTASTEPSSRRKAERISWLAAQDDGPTRSSTRKLTVQNKELTQERLKEKEKQRLSTVAVMRAAEQRREREKTKTMTQEERLAEAAKVERHNSKSLTKWEEAERIRSKERKAKLDAMKNRRMEGPFIRYWSGPALWENEKLKRVGKNVLIMSLDPSIEDSEPSQEASGTPDAMEIDNKSPELPREVTPEASTKPLVAEEPAHSEVSPAVGGQPMDIDEPGKPEQSSSANKILPVQQPLGSNVPEATQTSDKAGLIEGSGQSKENRTSTETRLSPQVEPPTPPTRAEPPTHIESSKTEEQRPPSEQPDLTQPPIIGKPSAGPLQYSTQPTSVEAIVDKPTKSTSTSGPIAEKTDPEQLEPASAEASKPTEKADTNHIASTETKYPHPHSFSSSHGDLPSTIMFPPPPFDYLLSGIHEYAPVNYTNNTTNYTQNHNLNSVKIDGNEQSTAQTTDPTPAPPPIASTTTAPVSTPASLPLPQESQPQNISQPFIEEIPADAEPARPTTPVRVLQRAARNVVMLESFESLKPKDKEAISRILFSWSQRVASAAFSAPVSTGRGSRGGHHTVHPPARKCFITNQKAAYLDPATGLAYFDSQAFKSIRGVYQSKFRWSTLLGAYMGPAVGGAGDTSSLDLNERHAKGVPPGFGKIVAKKPRPPPEPVVSAPTAGAGAGTPAPATLSSTTLASPGPSTTVIGTKPTMMPNSANIPKTMPSTQTPTQARAQPPSPAQHPPTAAPTISSTAATMAASSGIATAGQHGPPSALPATTSTTPSVPPVAVAVPAPIS